MAFHAAIWVLFTVCTDHITFTSPCAVCAARQVREGSSQIIYPNAYVNITSLLTGLSLRIRGDGGVDALGGPGV